MDLDLDLKIELDLDWIWIWSSLALPIIGSGDLLSSELISYIWQLKLGVVSPKGVLLSGLGPASLTWTRGYPSTRVPHSSSTRHTFRKELWNHLLLQSHMTFLYLQRDIVYMFINFWYVCIAFLIISAMTMCHSIVTIVPWTICFNNFTMIKILWYFWQYPLVLFRFCILHEHDKDSPSSGFAHARISNVKMWPKFVAVGCRLEILSLIIIIQEK